MIDRQEEVTNNQDLMRARLESMSKRQLFELIESGNQSYLVTCLAKLLVTKLKVHIDTHERIAQPRKPFLFSPASAFLAAALAIILPGTVLYKVPKAYREQSVRKTLKRITKT